MVLGKLSSDLSIEKLVEKKMKKDLTPFLERCFDYEFKGENFTPDTLTGDYYEYTFINKNLDLELTVLFSTGNAEYECHFSIFLENDAGRLDMDSLLRKHGVTEKVKNFSCDPSKQVVGKFIDGFFIFIKNEFNGSFKDYLTGNKFEDTPIDWMGMK